MFFGAFRFTQRLFFFSGIDLVFVKVDDYLRCLGVDIAGVLFVALSDLLEPHDLGLLGVLLLGRLFELLLLGRALRGGFFLLMLFLLFISFLRIRSRVLRNVLVL